MTARPTPSMPPVRTSWRRHIKPTRSASCAKPPCRRLCPPRPGSTHPGKQTATKPNTTVAYRPCTALTHYILWLSSELSAKCAVLIHYATVVLNRDVGCLKVIDT